MNELASAIWFFLPAGIANAAPVFLNKIPVISRWKTPLDFGKSYHGYRLSGDNKTWRGLLLGGGVFGGLTALLLHVVAQHHLWGINSVYGIDYASPSVVLLGVLLGLGALLGDAIESLFKRRRGVASGEAWFPYDQTDYILGGLLFSLPFVRLPITAYILIAVVWFGMHLLFSYIGYRLGLKSKPI